MQTDQSIRAAFQMPGGKVFKNHDVEHGHSPVQGIQAVLFGLWIWNAEFSVYWSLGSAGWPAFAGVAGDILQKVTYRSAHG